MNSAFRSQAFSRRTVLKGSALGGLGLVATGLVGCGDDDADDPVEPDSSATAAQSGPGSYADLRGRELLDAIPSDIPRDFEYADITPGGTFTWVPAANPATLDPHTSASTSVAAPTGLTYSRLLRLKTNSEAGTFTPEVVADLAESSEQPDDQSWIFKLTPGVTFHDVAPTNGRALTADDVVATFERLRTDPAVPNRSFFASIDRVQATDETTVRFDLASPVASFPLLVSGFFASILPPELIATPDTAKLQPAGTGPFVFQNWTDNVELQWTKNPNYFHKDPAGNPLPYLDGVTYKVIPDAASRLAAIRSGQADMAFGAVTVDNLEDVLSSMPDMQLQYAHPWYAHNGQIAVRNDVKPFDDPRVRRALNLAVPREDIVNTFMSEWGFHGMFFPWSMIQDTEPTIESLGEWFQYDPKAAKDLLSAAGVTELTIDLPFHGYGGTLYRSQFELLQQVYQQELGIDLTLRELEYTAYFTLYKSVEYPQACLANYGLQYPDLDAFVQEYRTGSSQNAANVSDPDLDALIDLQHVQLDAAERAETATQIHDMMRDNIYTVWMPVPKSVDYWPAHIKNWRESGWYSQFFNSHLLESVWRA